MDNDVKTKNNEEIAHFLNASDRMIKGNRCPAEKEQTSA